MRDGPARCPVCDGQTEVKDSRGSVHRHVVVRRRRKCMECGFIFTTHETYLDLDHMVVGAQDFEDMANRLDRLADEFRLAAQRNPVEVEIDRRRAALAKKKERPRANPDPVE